ncbi:hypothetical protein [Actinomadura sp. 9N407]|uniref:hypothetical protein n=1 Tax=Actinomadura sp. 9N407 TaxID=3375154 RepID=UPI0037B19D1D
MTPMPAEPVIVMPGRDLSAALGGWAEDGARTAAARATPVSGRRGLCTVGRWDVSVVLPAK